jgi:hypothetical protein
VKNDANRAESKQDLEQALSDMIDVSIGLRGSRQASSSQRCHLFLAAGYGTGWNASKDGAGSDGADDS